MSRQPASQTIPSADDARPAAVASPMVSTVHPRAVGSLREHPDAQRIPLLPEAEYAELRADIRARGVLDPLRVMRDGTVVDGRHRLRVARELGLLVVPCLELLPNPEEDPYERMLRSAVLRRHLSPGQRAALALELVACRRAHARVRAPRSRGPTPATAPVPAAIMAGKTRDVAAGLGSVSPRTVQAVLTVKQKSPKLYRDVRSGTRSANAAARELRRRSPNYRDACRQAASTRELGRAIGAIERIVGRLEAAHEQPRAAPLPASVRRRWAVCAQQSAATLRALASTLSRLAIGLSVRPAVRRSRTRAKTR